ncbi:zinc ABC transporter substrate-binding protein [Neobacillus sp. DY30]|uniref:metal ABC transporter solute-binding protein, Zn/Mn family n=1 Tax=Neobacillus sp. DY30 TaxID=3047871 RepID=UPI0024C0E444|nr:zinc ABC transporter substrate-binding protein [Neobacillus sp. DY30]WHX98145.1 zinc ABC transporter substrate-binding protein [Neobacillus sp. DY30]
MKIPKFIFSTMLMSALLLTACSAKETQTSEETEKNGTLKVSTTIYPLEDFAKKIGGNFVEIQSIYPPGVDAHSFEPTTKDMVSLAESDLFIYTGAGVEGFADKAVETLEKEDVTIVKAAEGINLLASSHSHEHEAAEDHADKDEEHSHEDEEHGHVEEAHEHGDVDPHVWLDPVLAIDLANNIKVSLTELKPEHADDFEANFLKLKGELETLDQEFQTVVENSKTKHLLVSHDAYGYWEERYGLETIAINGLSPTQEPSQKELAEIIKESTQHGIKYVIFEQNVSQRVSEIIQNEIGAKSLTLHNLEALTKENVKEQEDYLSIMRKNIDVIKTALN